MAAVYRKLGVLIGCVVLALLVGSSAGVSQAFVTLTVVKAGTGSGTVTSSPEGINCGTTCSASFTRNTTVTLTATPSAGSTVSGWSGCDSVSSDNSQCTVTMTTNRTVTVTFSTTATFTLTVTVSGNGSVSSSPSGINGCRGTCSASFAANTTVTLTASPDSGWSFGGWGGACSGTGTCQITMDANKSVTATFSQNPVLTVNVSGTGTGTVTSSPSGINCGFDCSEPFARDTQVILTATPDAGSTVSSWSGCDSVSQDKRTCTVRMTGSRTVTVTFARAVPVCYYQGNVEGTAQGDVCQPLDRNVLSVLIRGDGDGNFTNGPTACPEAGCGDDKITGTDGDDIIFGDDGLGGIRGTGHDWIMAGGGNDIINGEAGNDIIFGGDGDDIIDGGPGNDVIDGGFGVDELSGGGGNDTFIIRAGNPSAGLGTTTIICTQSPGESGRVLVRGNFKARIPFGTYRSRETTVQIEDRSVSFSTPMIYEIMTGPGKCTIRRG